MKHYLAQLRAWVLYLLLLATCDGGRFVMRVTKYFSGVRLAPIPLFTLPVHVYWNRMANWQSTSPTRLWPRHHTWTQTTHTGKFCNWPHDRCCWSDYVRCIQQTPLDYYTTLMHVQECITTRQSSNAGALHNQLGPFAFALALSVPPPLPSPSFCLSTLISMCTHQRPSRRGGLCPSNKTPRLFAGGTCDFGLLTFLKQPGAFVRMIRQIHPLSW